MARKSRNRKNKTRTLKTRSRRTRRTRRTRRGGSGCPSVGCANSSAHNTSGTWTSIGGMGDYTQPSEDILKHMLDSAPYTVS